MNFALLPRFEAKVAEGIETFNRTQTAIRSDITERSQFDELSCASAVRNLQEKRETGNERSIGVFRNYAIERALYRAVFAIVALIR